MMRSYQYGKQQQEAPFVKKSGEPTDMDGQNEDCVCNNDEYKERSQLMILEYSLKCFHEVALEGVLSEAVQSR